MLTQGNRDSSCELTQQFSSSSSHLWINPVSKTPTKKPRTSEVLQKLSGEEKKKRIPKPDFQLLHARGSCWAPAESWEFPSLGSAPLAALQRGAESSSRTQQPLQKPPEHLSRRLSHTHPSPPAAPGSPAEGGMKAAAPLMRGEGCLTPSHAAARPASALRKHRQLRSSICFSPQLVIREKC